LAKTTLETTDSAILACEKISDGCYLTLPDKHVLQFFVFLPSGEIEEAVQL
jgi:hypothetical protein